MGGPGSVRGWKNRLMVVMLGLYKSNEFCPLKYFWKYFVVKKFRWCVLMTWGGTFGFRGYPPHFCANIYLFQSKMHFSIYHSQKPLPLEVDYQKHQFVSKFIHFKILILYFKTIFILEKLQTVIKKINHSHIVTNEN